MTRSLSWLLSLALASLLAACGFHLRGLDNSGAREFPFKTLYIDSSAGVGSILADRLKFEPGVKLVTTARDAEAILKIPGEQRNRDISTIDRAGQASEYRLMYRVTAQLFIHGEQIGKDIVLTQTRTMTYSDNEVLGKSQEEDLLWSDMQRNAAQLLMYRLSTGQIRKEAASAAAASAMKPPVRASNAVRKP